MERSDAVSGAQQQGDTGASGAPGYLSSLGDGEWDPEELLSAMDDNIGHFSPELLTDPFQRVIALDEGTTQIQEAIQPQKKKTKLNYDPNKVRNERRFQLIELREKVKELEMKLKQMHHPRRGEAYGVST
ncbi:hypothetical protein GN244_ATG09010 [Phytophthora infestans]|uniref:Uncharacterized protein n=1 Tax=Phytophthora infestans TaxID=4787 RepID=A0A833W1X5_PHYIN|nr:hypothetical protein GN244_ATG09010 [Phytophthora infestans]